MVYTTNTIITFILFIILICLLVALITLLSLGLQNKNMEGGNWSKMASDAASSVYNAGVYGYNAGKDIAHTAYKTGEGIAHTASAYVDAAQTVLKSDEFKNAMEKAKQVLGETNESLKAEKSANMQSPA